MLQCQGQAYDSLFGPLAISELIVRDAFGRRVKHETLDLETWMT
jgi:hypothetical protein